MSRRSTTSAHVVCLGNVVPNFHKISTVGTNGLTKLITIYSAVFSCYNDTTLPTILFIMGWRFFFYANEGHEPIHIHCKKGDKECKYWLDSAAFEVEEAHSYNMNNADKREVKKIIFEYFDLIEDEWKKFQRER